ncbi:unnamed protein product [Heligmosomoides polygyrus]|uniref:Chloroplast protein-transporting ATPase n=1 Tax=Heligmosomoides polygyrus TaxID=6339 RepID=A0A3P8EUX6_HELPZ|nr:unnamed protein product [Heligmosomoides polygyrus]
MVETRRLKILAELLAQQPGRHKQILAKLRKLLNQIVTHFSKEQPEKELVRLIINWFKSGEMCIEHYRTWRALTEEGSFSLSDIRKANWFENSENSFFTNFKIALKELPVKDLCRESYGQLWRFLSNLASKTEPKKERTGIRLRLFSKLLFLSDVRSKLETFLRDNPSIFEVNIYAEYAIILDCNLENFTWHGINLSLAAEKIIIRKECEINVSGKSYPRGVRGKARSGSNAGERGEDGSDGEAGESSGNILLATNELKNPEKLKLILNGGDGQGGEDGGDGVDGVHGEGSTKEDLFRLMIKYDSLYWSSWTEILNHSPGAGWTERFKRDGLAQQWMERCFVCEDGREIDFAVAGRWHWFFTVYDLRFLLRGAKGSAGSEGGRNGLGGEGGNRGELTAISLARGKLLTGFEIAMRKGDDGIDGKCGTPGAAGSHGNDVALIDRSGDFTPIHMRKSQRLYGTEKRCRLSYSYEHSSEVETRFSGYRKHSLGRKDCFVKIVENDVERIQATKTATKKAVSERRSTSKATSKQSITEDVVLQEYWSRCASEVAEVQFSGDSEFKFKVTEEVEEEIAQERISIMRTHIDKDEIYYEEKKRSCSVDVESLQEQIQSQCNRASQTDLDEQIALWNDVFSVPFEIKGDVKAALDRMLANLLDSQTVTSAFENRPRLKNGMTQEELKRFAKEVEKKLHEKKLLSTISPRTVAKVDGISDADVNDGLELRDVRPVPLDDFWMKHNNVADGFRERILNEFFDQLEHKYADTELLVALYRVYRCLSKHDAAFEKYKSDAINWCSVEEAKTYLSTFLSCEEHKKSDGEEDPPERSFEMTAEQTALSPPEEVEATKRGWTSKILTFQECLTNFLNSPTQNSSFPEIIQLLKDNKGEITAAFHPLALLMGQDGDLFIRFTTEFGRHNGPLMPGTTPMSLIHMYFMTQQLLDYNMLLYKFHMKYATNILTPRDWYTGEQDPRLDRGCFIESVKINGMPTNHSDLRKFMLRHGLKCGAYRQFVADLVNTNVQVFCTSGYSRLRLVENLNPTADFVRKIFISSSGEVASVGPDMAVRTLRSNIGPRKLNVPLPRWDHQPDIAVFFDEKAVAEEWSRAVTASIGSEFLKFLHKLFSLRGCMLSTLDLQFMLNTVVLLHGVIGVPLEDLCSYVLQKDGAIEDIWLAVRISVMMKEDAPELRELTESLSVIKEPRLRALFGVKIRENDLDRKTLRALTNMLAHAEDRVPQLEKTSMKDWIDIAKCQTWVSYAPLLKKYGSVGYCFVFLNSHGRSEGLQLQSIIDGLLAKGPVVIFEKLISRIAHTVANDEIEFNYNTAMGITRLLTVGSLVATMKIHFENFSSQEFSVRDHVQRFGNLFFLVNESLQCSCMKEVKTMREWNFVFPENSRTLSDIIRLSVNPNDDDKQRCARKATMGEVQALLENRVGGDEEVQMLRKIDDVLYEKRKVRLRNTQKVAVLSALRNRKNLLCQVNTGEGKSYIILALAIIRVLMGGDQETVDIITSSCVLAQRDAENMKDIYESFDIKVGHNCDEDVDKRKNAYKCAVVYGDIARFQRDYLIHTFYQRNILGSRKRCNVIVDEVDSMLLDSGSNMLYLSHNVPGLELLDSLFVFIHRELRMPSLTAEEDPEFNSQALRRKVLMDMYGMVTKTDIAPILYDQKDTASIATLWRLLLKNGIVDEEGILLEFKDISLANFEREVRKDCGATLAGRILAMINVVQNRHREITVPGYLRKFVLAHLDEFIDNAKKALFLQHNDDYVVDLDHTGRVPDLHPLITIIDRGTGTDLATSQWSEGLHQFVQLKHGCRLAPLSLKAVFVSNVSYLKGYKKLNGFSGTLGSKEESNTLVALYDADLMRIPTWKAKAFSENAPILVSTTAEWIEQIYGEICNQVRALRSVLVICRSISEVERLYDGFVALCDQNSPAMNKELGDAFQSMLVYKREFDEFDFSVTGGLACRRIIISTNLAGRGTDIELTEELAAAGGLHVIVSYLPENSRIEDQAYGRAARCGQPGSGQIIAVVDDDSDTNIFQLKQFRDNAEVHRLQALKHFFDYHIDVEEACLRLFRDHCSSVLSDVYSYSHDDLPSEHQVIYFALLDEWAMWLDGRAQAIKKCEADKSSQQKAEIIESVKKFIEQHPLPIMESEDCEVDRCFSWITCPQPLIAWAIIDISRNKPSSALEKLERVEVEYPEFAAEVLYYKGVIKQQQIRRTKGNGEGSENQTENDPEMLMQSTTCLLSAKGLLMERIQQKNILKDIASKLLQNPTTVRSRGFAAQQEEANFVLRNVISSIDDMLGHTVKPEDIRLENEPPSLHIRRFKDYQRAAIFSPTTLSRNFSDQQLRLISCKHGVSLPVLKTALSSINQSEDLEVHDGLKVVSADLLSDMLPLPSVTGFWKSLRRSGGFLQEKVFIAVKKSDLPLVGVVSGLKPVTLKEVPFRVQLSTTLVDDCNLYDVYGDASSVKENDLKNAEIRECLEAGTATVELLGEMNPLVLFAIEHLDEFDYLTEEILISELAVAPAEASWILQKFVEYGVLEKRVADMKCAKQEENSFLEESEEGCVIVGSFIYTLTGRATCEMFPENMRKSLEEIMAKHFCYGYALSALRSSVRKATDGQNIVHRIFLPEQPYLDLYRDLLMCGVLQHERLTSVLKNVYALKTSNTFIPPVFAPNISDYFVPKQIYDRLEQKSPSILLKKCSLVSTAYYLRRKGVTLGPETQRVIAGGMRQIAVVTEPSSWRASFLNLLPRNITLPNVVSIVGVRFLSPVALAISLVATAAVATTEFVMTTLRTLQKMRSSVRYDVDEFKILRDFHEAAIVEHHREEKAAKLMQVLPMRFVL